MLFDREYKPNHEELIYHYCNSNSFHAICSNKTLRISDVFSMNDFMEVHWGYSIWEEVATDLIKEFGEEFIDNIDKVLHTSGAIGLLLATCFSQNGDVLSQWRAYADDGKGYAIGFRAKDILQLPIRSLRVLYDKKKQIKELTNVIKATYEVEKSQNFKYDSDFESSCLSIAYDLIAFKNPAFREEKEIRIVHLLNFEKSNDFLKLVDNGGTAFGKESKGKNINFLMRENTPVPFIYESFINTNNIHPIKEIYIGPKNDVLPTAVSVFLETIGLGKVEIRKSNASYR
tara:strand:- start:199 stop:1059 length:861 start_codon:yes stop_codon:yes gene_type:complete